MSHISACDAKAASSTLVSRHVWRFLTRIDEDLASGLAGSVCPDCDLGRLNRADYARAASYISAFMY